MRLFTGIFCLFLLSCDDIGLENDNKVNSRSFINSFGTSWYEYGWGLTQLHDGGFAVVGRKEQRSNKKADMILIRTDENGFGIWEKTYGGSDNDEGYSVVQTPDGNILSVGFSWSYGNKQQILVVKTDLSGHLIWRKTYGGSNREIGHKAIISSDGNILIVGQTNSPGISRGNDDIWLIKIDQDGNEIWNKAYGLQNHEKGYDIIELDGGEFIIVGYRDFYQEGDKNILILKIDFEGNPIWEKIIGVDGVYEEVAYSISKSSDYGYLICSSTNAKGNNLYDPQIINIDFDGNVIWNETYNGSGLSHTRWSATSTKDGGAVIIGTTNYYGGDNEDAYILKINKEGKKLWDYAVQGGENDWGWAIIETFFEELVLVGTTKSFGSGLFDILLARISNFPEN